MKSNITWLKCPSWGEVRKNHLKPALGEQGGRRLGVEVRHAVALRDLGHRLRSLPRSTAPNTACTFSWVMRRSASAWPTSGLPWWSTKITRTLAPPSPGRPSPFPRGRLRSWLALMMSTASRTAFTESIPTWAALPESG